LNPRILLIDDSDEICVLVRKGLEPYSVEQARTISEAESALSASEHDLILIDVSLPDGDGFDLCLKLNETAQHKNTPKILLTAKDQVSEKVYGFKCGADDYVTKPFHHMELKARVDRFLKERSDLKDFVQGCFSFNLEFQKCSVQEAETSKDLGLTPTEFRLFLFLAKNEGRLMTRQDLEKAAWESHGASIEKRGIDTHIAHLRKKLGDLKSCIISVYGQGYSFKWNTSEQTAA
jgi:two-component system, OmpR family, response regulator RegX3